jgi:hypothetical protein
MTGGVAAAVAAGATPAQLAQISAVTTGLGLNATALATAIAASPGSTPPATVPVPPVAAAAQR